MKQPEFVALLLGLTLLLAACAPAQAESPPTPWPTLTPILLPTPTLAMTWRPTPAPAPAAGPVTGCGLTELWPGSHISASGSYTETQTQAAGGMVCRIGRADCAYHQLVGHLSPDIVFKREEEPPYDQEDILMHPAMVYPLSRLSELVQAEWGGQYRLRVTDAYDSLLEHDLGQPDENRKNSLHFEGRAVDLTLWPIERAHYSRLCALAHCAGFDWVHNEGTHCHAAIKAGSLCGRC